MSARVLVVDDLFGNAKHLCERLHADHFETIPALGAAEAIAVCRQGLCDIVVSDTAMPEMDGFALCRALKADPQTAHLPFILVTAWDQPGDRLKGLDCGVDEFLTRPVDEIALTARIRAAARLKSVDDELRARAVTAKALGGTQSLETTLADTGLWGSILIIEDRAASSERLAAALGSTHHVVVKDDPQEALFAAAGGNFDLVIVSLDVGGYDGLRLCGQLRSLERLRQAGLLLLAQDNDMGRVLRGLDIGANDYLTRPADRCELLARARGQIRRKRRADRLRETADCTLDPAIADPLTRLANRRYLDSHCATLIERAERLGRPLSLLMLDIDRFRSVNEGYGLDAGDAVLRGLAARIRRHLRPVDLSARWGGEEFVVVLPDTPAETASAIAERIRFAVEGERFAIDGGARAVPITISVGVVSMAGPGDTAPALLKRADEALYRAKGAGRNRVVLRNQAA